MTLELADGKGNVFHTIGLVSIGSRNINFVHLLYSINFDSLTKASISLECDNFATSWRQRSAI